jgi:enediyne biosynthesis protein E4
MNHSGVPDEKPWIAEAKGGGTVVLDYDLDGDVDILFVDGNGVGRPPHPDARTRLFRNDGGMRFTDVTKEARIDITGVGFGGVAADYDGDGDPDAFVAMLLRNNGDGTFVDAAAAAGVEGGERDMSTAGCWADFDGDGNLDLYVSNYVDMLGDIERWRKAGRGGGDCPWHGIKVFCGPGGLTAQLDRLYLSNGPDPRTGAVTFREATERLADQDPRPSFQCVAADFDRDGDMDVYTATDSVPHFLWINDGTGYFRDVGMVAGCGFGIQGNTQAGMGVDVSDYDHDGRLDLTVTNFSQDSNSLYRNLGLPRKSGPGLTPVFRDDCIKAGIAPPTLLPVCWAALFTDYDGDGDRDLFYSAGHVYPGVDSLPDTGMAYRERNILLENTGGTAPVFVDASGRAGPGFRVAEVHRGGGLADLDDDGDEDVVLAVLNGKAYILRNDGGNRNGWIRFTLRGKRPVDPAGALVKVEAEGLLPQWDVATRGDSFLSSSDPRLLFGLGGAAGASKVTVTWPSGATASFPGLDGSAHWLLEEGVPAAKRLPK